MYTWPGIWDTAISSRSRFRGRVKVRGLLCFCGCPQCCSAGTFLEAQGSIGWLLGLKLKPGNYGQMASRPQPELGAVIKYFG